MNTMGIIIIFITQEVSNAVSVSISGDGTHIAFAETDTNGALNYCDIRDPDDVDCYSIYTDGEFNGEVNDIDLNFNASAVIAGFCNK